ncbi:MAG TPA: lipoprotein insertase outer membrane protein LolB [Burkholderiaceae bacterium]|nr:lipoprotein insertase outer membrane protein LolB [Burkholderiaceae bacterium]
MSPRASHLFRAWLGLLLVAAIFLAGCAHPPRTPNPAESETPFWSGRLALQTEAEPPQTFSAGFELKGNAQSGELLLFSPLGQTVAALSWAPGKASLRTNNTQREFDSLDALVANAAGTAIPIAALFDWLAGREAAVPGWHADLSQLGNGRLVAKRSNPAPVAVLRVALER